jgi:hypothetical protein
MDLKDFISIRGKGDLYRVMSKSNSGIIVETLNEKRTKFKVQPNLQVLILNDITIYSKEGDDIKLLDIFLNLYGKSKENVTIDHKSDPVQVIDLFKEVAPGFDDEKVYLSDMKKALRWFITINAFYPDLMEKLKEQTQEEADKENAETTVVEEPKVEAEEVIKPKKPAKKKASPPVKKKE